ncbi:uncharacterized protein LOC144920721 [Branchiostoma floridae x Branchiostoma belcheri]
MRLHGFTDSTTQQVQTEVVVNTAITVSRQSLQTPQHDNVSYSTLWENCYNWQSTTRVVVKLVQSCLKTVLSAYPHLQAALSGFGSRLTLSYPETGPDSRGLNRPTHVGSHCVCRGGGGGGKHRGLQISLPRIAGLKCEEDPAEED